MADSKIRNLERLQDTQSIQKLRREYERTGKINDALELFKKAGYVVRLNDQLTVSEEPHACPFCGQIKPVEATQEIEDFKPENNPTGFMSPWAVVCNYNKGGCGGSSGWRDDKKQAISAWNKGTRRVTDERSNNPPQPWIPFTLPDTSELAGG